MQGTFSGLFIIIVVTLCSLGLYTGWRSTLFRRQRRITAVLSVTTHEACASNVNSQAVFFVHLHDRFLGYLLLSQT